MIVTAGRSCDVCGQWRPDTTYCPACDAWICADCRPLWGRRTLAALRRWLR